MHRRWLRLALVPAAALLLGGCALLFPQRDEVQQAIARCELDADPSPSFRAASRELIDAARAGRLALADDSVLVGYESGPGDRGGPPPAALLATAAALEPGSLRTLAPGLALLRSSADPLVAAERLLDEPGVRFAHPNPRLVPHDVPDDPLFDRQWNLASFGLPEAWSVETGSARVTVAIIDAGLDPTHPDFAGRLEPGWDFYDGDADPSSDDVHGTHVTGIAGANGDDGRGVAGVARSAVRLLPIKVFDDDGRDSEGRAVTAVVRALHWAAGHAVEGPAQRPAPVAVANLSLGTAGAYTVVPALEDAVREARRQGVLVIASAGNDGRGTGGLGVTAPANGPCAVAVGSIDEDLGLSSFSNYDEDERLIDLVAPGGASNDGRIVLSTAPNDGYDYLQGTSMSAPFVSGTAALLASYHPAWRAEELLEQLLRSAWSPADADPFQVGFGIACPDAALGLATRCGRP